MLLEFGEQHKEGRLSGQLHLNLVADLQRFQMSYLGIISPRDAFELHDRLAYA